MSYANGPKIVTDGLVLCLDAANRKSYPGTGTTWYDLSGNGNNANLVNGVSHNSNNSKHFIFDGSNDYANNSTPNLPTGNISATVSAWINRQNTSTQWQGIVAWGPAATSNAFGLATNQSKLAVFTWGSTNTQDKISTYLIPQNEWTYVTATINNKNIKMYVDGINIFDESITATPNVQSTNFRIASADYPGRHLQTQIGGIKIYNRALSGNEIQENYNTLKGRFAPNGTLENPFNSPAQARSLGYPDGNYYFIKSSMSSSRLLEFKNNYYENKPWVCVFRSPYNSTATTNHLGFNIPMGGLLVQRDTLDIRAAVYWSNPISYNAVGGSGNNTADSGYSPRRVILGSAGGHGIYTTSQNACSWANGPGAVGAGWNGSTCGSFPNGLLWGTGQSNTATYANMSGVWSHWIYWE